MIPEAARIEDKAAIKQLLVVCGLPHADITAAHLNLFWVLRDDDGLVAVVGLEIGNAAALLRSLATLPRVRGRGYGERLLRQAEDHAQSQGVKALYLLTETAEEFFLRRGYLRTERGAVPAAIRATAEFRDLCPDSATCMVKQFIE